MMFLDLGEFMTVREISRISGIPLSTYYYRPRSRTVNRIDSVRSKRITDLALERPTYGYRRIWAVLRNEGIGINRKTVARVLNKNNLSLPAAKHKNRTERRDLFTPDAPDQLWETDITYIPTFSGMTYLMCIKDCFSKEWQGYLYSTTCTASDAVRSVDDAVSRTFDGSVAYGLTLRVDNGPQYGSKLFRKAMKLLGIRLEYIQKQTPEDNGDIESFHNSIKTDYIWPVDLSNFQEGKDIIDHAFRDYNEKRPHSSILFLSPREFRKRWDSDPEFRLEYKNSLKKMKDKAMAKRKNNKRMEAERNGIL